MMSSNITEYRIVRGYCSEVEEIVNKLIKEGWIPIGGSAQGNGIESFSQAMILTQEVKDQISKREITKAF